MKLCSLCYWLLQKRRWLALPIGLALALPLCFLLPRWLGMLLLAAPLLLAALLLVYARGMKALYAGHHARMSSPADAQAEIIMVDASLVDLGTQLQAAAQPLNPCPEMSMRMGSGALLLGTAMVSLSDELPMADSRALLAGVAKMNLRAQLLRSRSPVIDRDTEDGMRRVTVQDGAQERSYFMADAATVAAGCGSIWEDRVHLMGQNDRERILDAAKYMEAGGCRVLAFATATDDERPIFLGLAALGDGLDLEAVRELQELRAMGLTLILRDDETVPLDMAALRRTLDVPDLHARPDIFLSTGSVHPDPHCLSIRMQPGTSLVEPIRQLRAHFGLMARTLRCLGSLLGLCLLCCCIAAGRWALLSVPAVLAAAYLSFGSPTDARCIRWPGALIAAGGCLLARLLMRAAVPAAADLAGAILCTVLAGLLSLSFAPRGQRPTLRSLLPVLIVSGAALLLLLTGLPLLPAALLPAAFGAVLGGLTGLLSLLTLR